MRSRLRTDRSTGSAVASSLPRLSLPGGAPAAAALAVVLAGAAVAVVFYPLYVIALLLVAIAVVGIIRYPIPAIGILLFVAPFHTAIHANVASRAFQGSSWIDYWKDAAILAIFARALGQGLVTMRRWPFRAAGDNLLIFFALAFTAIAITSPRRASVYPALGLYVEGPLLLVSILLLRPSRKQILFLASMLVATATVLGGTAVIEWFGPRTDLHRWYGATVRPGGQPFIVGAGVYRAGSFLYDPLVLGFFMAGAIPLALGLMVSRTVGRSAAGMALLTCIAGLIASLVRSGFIGGGVAFLVVLALVVRNPRIRLALLGMTIVVAGSIAGVYIIGGSETLLRTESNELHRQRLDRAFNLFLDRPQGYGLGRTDRFQFAYPNDPGQLGPTESTYLAHALEAGFHGFGLYLVALFATGLRLRGARRRALQRGDPTGVALASGGIGSMLAIALCGLFLGVHELPVELMLWVPAGLALAWSATAPTAHAKTP